MTLALGIPNLSGVITGAILDLVERLREVSCLEVIRVEGINPDWYARNRIVRRFLDGHAERLWMLDDDMLPSPESLALLDSPYPVTSSLCYIWQPEQGQRLPRMVPVAATADANNPGQWAPIPFLGAERYIEVDAVGTGSLLVDRCVLEDRRLWHDTRFADYGGEERDIHALGDRADPVFRSHYAPTGYRFAGSDFDFSHRAKVAGYEVALDQHAPMGHRKAVDLTEVRSYTERLCDGARLAARVEVQT